MTGVPDPLYVAARRTLLDALEALGVHGEAVVVVGAQAVYLHAGGGDLALAPYTTDADLAIDTDGMDSSPEAAPKCQKERGPEGQFDGGGIR